MKLRIEKPIYGGAGLARAEGKAVFVPFSLPGEVVEAHLVEENRSYASAGLDAVIEPSAERMTAPCRYFGTCGGCHYQHAAYAAQLEMKAAILRETLERARIAEVPEIVPVFAEPLAYRNRVRLHVQRQPFGLCYKRRNSHVHLPVETCPIAAPELQEDIAILNREGEGLGLGHWAQELELFTNADASALLLSLWTGRSAQEAQQSITRIWPQLQSLFPSLAGAGVFSAENRRGMSRLLAHAGEGALPYMAAGRRYRVSFGSFFQTNRFLPGRLVELATGEASGNTVWDLYAGVGLFSLPLTETFAEVTAVEVAASSVRDLRENLRGTRHRVVAAETAAFLRRALQQREPAPDLVVVDPPRAGLSGEITTLLGKIRPRNMTYVSCDPATLSRDLAALLESGYRLRNMHLVDLFPQTFHLESVTQLSLRA